MHAAAKAFSALGAFAVFCLLSQPAVAQDSLTVATKVYPLMQQGSLTGCQLAFSVVRVDREYSDGNPALANGLILFDTKGRVSVRLGVASDKEFEDFKPPARAYLYGQFKSNMIDFVSRADSSEKGFALFMFKLGDATTSLLLKLMDKGVIDVMYGPPNTTVDARFTIDLASQPEQYTEYMDCMTAAVEALN